MLCCEDRQDADSELKIDLLDSLFWTDSNVLKYIENEKLQFKTFIANCIAVIRELTTPQQWRYDTQQSF